MTDARDRLLDAMDHADWCHHGIDECGCRCYASEQLDTLLFRTEDLAEAAGLDEPGAATEAYEQGRQWGERYTARKIAEKIIRTSRGHEHSMWIGMSHAAHIARSFAMEDSIRRGLDQAARGEVEQLPWVTEEDSNGH